MPLSLTAERALRTWLTAAHSLGNFVLTIRTTRGIEKALKLCDNAGIADEGREVHSSSRSGERLEVHVSLHEAQAVADF